MKPTFLLGAASVLFKNRKIQVILAGLQLGYLIYKMVQDDENQPKKLKMKSIKS